MNILRYKDFEGSAEVDTERLVCFGKLLFIADLVTYESDSVQGLQREFEAAVDDYVETCRQLGREPMKPCRGQFNVRVPPEVHRAAARRAIIDNSSLNDVVRRALVAYLQPPPERVFDQITKAARSIQILSSAMQGELVTVRASATDFSLEASRGGAH